MACAVTDRVRERILREVVPFVEKPSRYIGREFLTVHKNPEAAAVRVALAFPDVYEIGMSHLGLKFLYQLLNRRPEVVAEREAIVRPEPLVPKVLMD